VGYLALLRLPGAARLAFAAIVGRVPIGMVPLAYILLLRAEGESYALAGSVAAALAIASGLAAIPQGRLVDRLGQARVLLVLAALNAAAIVALLLAARAEAAAGALIALGALSGLTIPPLSACMRTLWPVLTGGGERLQTAFALEAVLQEVFYVAGPLLVGAIVAIASPDAAVVTAAVLTLAGTALFVSSPLSRAQRGGSSAAGRLGALAAPGLRTMILVLLPVGIAFGALEVTVPAFAEQHGSRSEAGLLLALVGLGSMIGGLWYGTRQFATSPERRFPVLLGCLALALVPPALAGSMPVVAVLLFVAGAPIAPVFSTAFTLIDRLAPEGAMTEAFTVTTTAVVAGVALGNAGAGALVDPAGPGWTFAAAAAVAALAPAAAVGRRHTLVHATAWPSSAPG
jgi:predicted MFS family arabinose efflux permease